MTNIEGTINAVKSAKINGIQKFVLLSTDKAVYPINAMGMTKALAEKVLQAKFAEIHQILIMVTRYGNVTGSRGSVIPLFIQQIINEEEITIITLL